MLYKMFRMRATYRIRENKLRKMKAKGLIHGYCHNEYTDYVTIHLGKGNRSIEFYVETQETLDDIEEILRRRLWKY